MRLKIPVLPSFAVFSAVLLSISVASCGKKKVNGTAAGGSGPDDSTSETSTPASGSSTDSSNSDTPAFGSNSGTDAEVDPVGTFTGPTAEMDELMAFRQRTRSFYNNRAFAKLERLAAKLHKEKSRFRDGDWKIRNFYECMDCRKEEPESMWQLHAEIHKDWEAKFPKSATARIATAEFLVTYAWHARTDAYADKVTEEGMKLFNERLVAAGKKLDEAKALDPSCPMLWYNYQTVALGQGLKPAEYAALFKSAKDSEPEFYPHDLARAKFLLPRWHGELGQWEVAAEAQIPLQGKAGQEIYARVIKEQASYYGNVFSETRVSWEKAKKAFEALRASYPDSSATLNSYCRMACFAGDKQTAKKLFAEIGDTPVTSEWRKGEFAKAKQWAATGD